MMLSACFLIEYSFRAAKLHFRQTRLCRPLNAALNRQAMLLTLDTFRV